MAALAPAFFNKVYYQSLNFFFQLMELDQIEMDAVASFSPENNYE